MLGKLVLSSKALTTGITSYTECIQLYALQGFLDWIMRNEKTAYSLVGLVQDELFGQHNSSNNSNGSGDNVPTTTTTTNTAIPLDLTKVAWAPLPWGRKQSVWDHQRFVLTTEFPVPDSDQAIGWIKDLLQKLVEMEKAYANRVLECKRRDDVRGTNTIPGYSASHVAAEDDAVVQSVRAKAGEVEKAVVFILEQLPEQRSSAASKL